MLGYNLIGSFGRFHTKNEIYACEGMLDGALMPPGPSRPCVLNKMQMIQQMQDAQYRCG